MLIFAPATSAKYALRVDDGETAAWRPIRPACREAHYGETRSECTNGRIEHAPSGSRQWSSNFIHGFYEHPRRTALMPAEFLRWTLAQLDQAAGNERTAIIHHQNGRSTVLQIGHPHAGRRRQSLAGHARTVGMESLAGRGAVSGLESIPGKRVRLRGGLGC